MKWRKVVRSGARLVGRAVLFALFASACLPQIAAAKSTFTLALPEEPDTLDPAAATLDSALLVTSQIYETLFQLSPTGEISGLLAADWSYASADRLRVRIRAGVKFSDGAPVDAAAVQASLTRLLDTTGRDPSLLETVTGVGVEDAYTVIIQTSEPYAPLMAHLAHPATAIVPGGHGRDLGRAPVGSGPYVLTAWQPAESLVLQASTDYWGGAPAIDQLTFRFALGPEELGAGLRAAAVQLAFRLPLSVYSELAAEPGIVTELMPGWSAVQLGINSTHPKLADLNVRQALALAIDKHSLVDAVPGGLVEAAVSALPPTLRLAPSDTLEPYPYEPEAARTLMERDGPADAAFTLNVPQQPELLFVAETLSRMLAEVGVVLKTRVLDGTQFLNQLEKDDLQLFLTSWSAPTFDPDQALFRALHSSTIPGGNASRYRVAAVDALLREARNSTSQVVRTADYLDVLDTVLTDLPVITLYYPQYAVAKTAALTGELLGPAWYHLDLRRAVLSD